MIVLKKTRKNLEKKGLENTKSNEALQHLDGVSLYIGLSKIQGNTTADHYLSWAVFLMKRSEVLLDSIW